MNTTFAADENGTVAIEFAVLLVPMLLIVALVVDIGLATTAKQQMQAATYEAARAQANGNADPQAVFTAGLSGPVKDTATLSCSTSGNVVTCDGAGKHTNVMAGLPGVGLLSNLTTHAVAVKPPTP